MTPRGWRTLRPGSGVISANDFPHRLALPLMTLGPPEVEMANGRQAGKTLDLVLGDRHRSRARRQGDGSLWRRWLHEWSAMDAEEPRPEIC